MSAADLWPSLNEIEQLTAKAVRGAGNGWGIAEDIARAARWRADRGVGWSRPLLRLLREGAIPDRFGPAFLVADLLSAARPGACWTIESREPGWVLPLLSAALRGRGLVLDVVWEACHVRLGPDGAASANAPLGEVDLDDMRTIGVTAVAWAQPLPCAWPAGAPRAAVLAADWDALGTYASRTYVASSAQSRATGAGGGRVDED